MTHPRVLAARQYIGVPFLHQGRSMAGFDCAGLCRQVVIDTGGNPPDIAAYGRKPWRQQFRIVVESFFGSALTRDPEPGDFVLMAVDSPHENHIAIVSDYHLGGLGLIHARGDLRFNGRKSYVTEHRLDEDWRRCIVGVYS